MKQFFRQENRSTTHYFLLKKISSRRLEQKEDYDWHAMMRRYAEEGIREEKMKEAKVAEKLRQQAEVHLQQKAEKERKDSLWKSEWQNPASLDVGEIRDPEAKKLAQVQRTREDLEKQIAETRKILEERRQQEEEIDKLGTTLAVGKEMSAEDMSRDRQRRCKEFWSYMENLMVNNFLLDLKKSLNGYLGKHFGGKNSSIKTNLNCLVKLKGNFFFKEHLRALLE